MRIAVLSDIHGNLPALEAVVDDVKNHSPDDIWCGGDVAWSGPWASECIEYVRSAGWKIVKGNADVWVTGDPQTVDDEDERRRFQSIADAHALDKADADWLLNLPLGHSGPGSILLVHATPESAFTAPAPDAPASEFEPYENKASVVVYGHVHKAFMRRLADQTIVANTGSVGLPLDDPTASYLLVDRIGPDFILRHRRVAFDRQGALAKAKALGGPIGESFTRLLDSV